MISYWSILSVPVEEKVNFMPLLQYAKAQRRFHENCKYMNLSCLKPHILNNISNTFVFFQVENECNRLEKLMSDSILRKKSKLDLIYQRTHLESPCAGQGNIILTYSRK